MTTLLLVLPVLVITIGFQVLKRIWPWLDGLDAIVKQLVIVAGSIAGSMLLVRAGLPVPPELQSLQSAAIVGLVQGLAAVGAHGVKKASVG